MIAFSEYESPTIRYPGLFPEWVYLYQYNLLPFPNYHISLNAGISTYNLVYYTAWDIMRELADKHKFALEFKQRDAGFIKCWELRFVDEQPINFIESLFTEVVDQTTTIVNRKLVLFKISTT